MKSFKRYVAEQAAHHDTDSFRSWFRNSKIVDDEGNPQVVYHATPADIKAFKVGGIDPTVSGHAIWLSPYAEVQAASHNIRTRHGFKDGTNVMPLYARVEKPLIIDDKNMLDWARTVFAGGSDNFPQLMPRKWVDEITRDGEYDGIIFDGQALGWGPHAKEIIVFSEKQIKSAIGNDGKYDVDNPRIDQ